MARSLFSKDFSAATIRALAKRGITIVGWQAIPDMSSSMPYANADRGYVVDDNGTGRVLRFLEILALAA